jgi:pSer/pThr/pTyr-binding forkhead associated (FHA) protein
MILKLVLELPDGSEQVFQLGKNSVTIGRATTNDIVLMDTRVSRTHARVECGEKGCKLIDLGSSNGSRVNGKRVESADLVPGDTLLLGGSLLRFESEQQETPTIVENMTMIDSEADLNATLASMILPVSLNETNAPRLVIYGPERTWEAPLEGIDHLVIGRAAEVELVLDHPKVSRRHAELFRKGKNFVLRDLNSANGTLVGGIRITETVLEENRDVHIGPFQLILKGGFTKEALTIADESLAATSERHPVVFVPGFMGSELWLGSQRVWPDVKTLFKNPEVYTYSPESRLEARGLLGEVVLVPNLIKLEQYNRLGDYLVEELGYERGKNYFEFSYDWRQDVCKSARQLGEAIENWPIRQPLVLMAHSMGTLVSRYYVERLGGKDKVARLLLMGGPHAGTPVAATNLVRGPNLLPFGIMGERLRQVLSTFPSLYQILPTYACAIDQSSLKINLLQEENWLSEEQIPLARQARGFRKELGMGFSTPTVSIFGYGMNTVAELKVLRDGLGHWLNVTFANKPTGDNTIPELSAVLPKTEIHPVFQHHGSLYVDNDVKMRLKMELSRI